VQAALALRDRERVAGQGEVVHADVRVAARQEAGDRVAEHRDAIAGAGQGGDVDPPLRLEPLGRCA
jgi:hypothetical protein